MNFDFFQKLAEEFPESAVTNLFYIFLGSLLINLFGYVKGIFESKDKRIEAMNDKKLDDILAGQKNLENKILRVETSLEL